MSRLKVIIGENASGKTLYLDNKIRHKTDVENSIDFVTNLDRDNYFRNLEYDDDKLEILEDVTYADRVDKSCEVIQLVDCDIKLSQRFIYLATILCKKVSNAYIDEPEKGLSTREKYILGTFLNNIKDKFDDFVIVTHNEIIANIPDVTVYKAEKINNGSEIKILTVPEEKVDDIID